MLTANLLSHLGWPSWGSKECVGTAHLRWLNFESQWSLGTLKKSHPPLFKNNKKIPKHINVNNKHISIFSLCITFPVTNMFLERRGSIYRKHQTYNHWGAFYVHCQIWKQADAMWVNLWHQDTVQTHTRSQCCLNWPTEAKNSEKLLRNFLLGNWAASQSSWGKGNELRYIFLMQTH